MLRAIESAGYAPGDQCYIALDVAASELLEGGDGRYSLAREGRVLSPLQLAGQYIKDLSFENPGVSEAHPHQMVKSPQIDLSVDLQGRRVNEQGQYEVVLKLRVTATHDKKTIFLVDLAYAGMFILKDVPDDSLQPLLLIECPRLLFPFARRVVSDVVRDGGLPTLMIDPIDFVALYRNKINEAPSQRHIT